MDEAALQVVAYAGILSALLAAIIACTQTDIKRVLAYSTMSQIGFMMFALGVSGYGESKGLGYTASMFHLFTHAFFKSLLFLCAGSIIHLVHSNDMKNMGGLRKLMPVTHLGFLIACLAISGIPPFAGFFSKEGILMATYESNKFIFFIALFTSALTAFYMFRLYFSIFWNKEAAPDKAHHGEGSLSMKIPLIILTVCSILAGFVPFSKLVTTDGMPMEEHINLLFSIAPVGLAILAILIAANLYKKENARPQKLSQTLGTFYIAAKRKFYIDEVYLFITQKVVFNLIGRPAAWIDRNIIDGSVNLLATVTGKTSQGIKGLQSGSVQNYALYFFSGIAALAVIFIYLWK
jgi:NADH-quinone oxidoreductase subunit L